MELNTVQELEKIRAFLASQKVNISGKALESGILMPKDMDGYSHPGYPRVKEMITVNPFPKIVIKKVPAKKKKGKKKE